MTNVSKPPGVPAIGTTAPRQLPPGTPAPELPSALDLIVCQGVSMQDVIDVVLGPHPDRRTGNPEVDLVAAAKSLDEQDSQLKLYRALVICALWTLLRPGNADTWLRVAQRVRWAKSTVHTWAHAFDILGH